MAILLVAGCNRGPELPFYNTVPDFELTDQGGRRFLSKDKLAGRVWVAGFIFTSCMGPCPRMSAQMKQLRDQTTLVSFTIDPARDTPEVLAAYGKRFGASPDKWFFLTGPQPVLHHLSKDIFMLQDVDGSLEHSSRLVLIDRHGRIRGYYESSDIKQLVADIGALGG